MKWSGKGREMLPVHWGPFNLAYHTWNELIIRTIAPAEQKDIALIAPKVVEFIDIRAETEFHNWREDVE